MFDALGKFRDQIGENDWVFVYFNHTIHLGKVAPGLLRKRFRQFDQGGDIFKARTVFEANSFQIAELPEPFRLLTSAGRSTLHQVPSTESLIAILAESRTPARFVAGGDRAGSIRHDWNDGDRPIAQLGSQLLLDGCEVRIQIEEEPAYPRLENCRDWLRRGHLDSSPYRQPASTYLFICFIAAIRVCLCRIRVAFLTKST
jgi:hypothetical protein